MEKRYETNLDNYLANLNYFIKKKLMLILIS